LRETASVDRLLDVAGPVTDPRAHELRRRYGELFGGGLLPVPVEAIAEDYLGLAVGEAELDGVSGLLYPAERAVFLNAQEPATRRRFTLAHELGHWVCQHLEGKEVPVFCRAEEVGLDPAVKALEREANLFAAELLMPEDDVRAAWDGDPEATAVHFGVSGEAMRWRLYSFGLGEPPR
jgi:hypothetical protein